MNPELFAEDLARKPQYLNTLAERLSAGNPWAHISPAVRRVVFVGMGSSTYAASIAAARLNRHGFPAVSVLASSDLLPKVQPGDLVIAVSAGGGSKETAYALAELQRQADVTLLTNTLDSPLASSADVVVDMSAGPEAGGVACRSFQHTLILLLALEIQLLGMDRDLPALIRATAAAGGDLADRRADWLPVLRELLDGPQGTHVVAPAARLSSAQQSALMLREGPRRQAYACETGDWSHVDVYLTKTTDYRMLLFTGSRWEPELVRWVKERGSTVVAVGGEVDGARHCLRYEGDGDDDVRLLTEVLVAELLAADIWTQPTR